MEKLFGLGLEIWCMKPNLIMQINKIKLWNSQDKFAEILQTRKEAIVDFFKQLFLEEKDNTIVLNYKFYFYSNTFYFPAHYIPEATNILWVPAMD
jgi:hypothetical protein